MTKNVAIITARGGSKRIPRKNIKKFIGQPIIAYSIRAALDSGLFSEVMVSTDDEEIASIAKSYGAAIPFFRSNENSDDYATTADVCLEVLAHYKSQGVSFDYACCIYPTAPFVSAQKLTEAYNLLLKENYDSVFPILPFGFPIWRSLKMEDNARISPNWQENLNKRSQDLPPAYHDAGQFYFFDTAAFLQSHKIVMENTGGIVLNEFEAHDIDTPMDWEIAEFKYQYLKNKQS